MNQAAIRRIFRAGLMVLPVAVTQAAYAQTDLREPVDMIFTDGTVLTPGGDADSLAIKDGVIVAVGSQQSVMALPHDGAKIVDLHGKTLMPGLYDSHVHLFYAGQDKLACRFPQGAGSAVILDAVRACAAKTRPGEWIIGGSWVGAAFKPGEQTAALLDKAAPNNPVLLNDESLHSIWVNSQALKLAGLSAQTADVEGGVIERDSKGMPSGVMRELATGLVESILPEASVAEQEKAVKVASDEMLSYGIVGLIDAGVRSSWIQGLSNYARSGQLKQYTRGCMVWGPNSAGSEKLVPERLLYEGGRLKLDCIKLFMDGVPTESRTGAMLEPYAHSLNEKGMLLIPQDELNELVANFDREGLHVKFHAAGDGSVRAAATAISYARDHNGFSGPRHDIGHNTFISPEDLPKAKAYNFTWEMSPYIWWPTPITSVDIATAVGPERMTRIWPVRDAIESQANVIVGSDWPVVPSVNPWIAFETLVTRQVPGATGEPINAGQRITREQALALLTRNGAAQMERLDRGGTIEVGKLADLIIVDHNPMTVPVGEIHNTKVLNTFIAGEEVYSAGAGDGDDK